MHQGVAAAQENGRREKRRAKRTARPQHPVGPTNYERTAGSRHHPACMSAPPTASSTRWRTTGRPACSYNRQTHGGGPPGDVRRARHPDPARTPPGPATRPARMRYRPRGQAGAVYMWIWGAPAQKRRASRHRPTHRATAAGAPWPPRPLRPVPVPILPLLLRLRPRRAPEARRERTPRSDGLCMRGAGCTPGGPGLEWQRVVHGAAVQATAYRDRGSRRADGIGMLLLPQLHALRGRHPRQRCYGRG